MIIPPNRNPRLLCVAEQPKLTSDIARRQLLFGIIGLGLQSTILLSAPLAPYGPILKPVPEPTLPLEFDTFTPPPSDGLSTTPLGSGVPQIAEYTQTGGPDESIVLSIEEVSIHSGDDFAKDVNFLIYGEDATEGEGYLTNGRILRQTNVGAVVNLDDQLPPWGMYLLWAGNANGYGPPVAINRTDAWWVGPNVATRNDSISVYGRNLAHNNGTTESWIYLKPSSGVGQWVVPTKVNPYRVEFQIPNGLTNGTYEVWTHNGHGASLGWSGPLSLTVNNGPNRSGLLLDVTTLGVINNGTTDNTAAINSLIAQYRNTGATLFFPQGIYKITGTITVPPSNMVLKGAGKGLTILKAEPPAPPTVAPTQIFPNQMNGAEILDMTVDTTSYAPNSLSSSVFKATSSVDLRLTRLEVLTAGNPVGFFHNNTLLRVKDCDFHGTTSMFLGTSKQIFIEGCKFYGMFDSTTMVYSWGSNGVSVTDSEGRDHDPSNLLSGAGFSSGRFYTGSGQWATEKNIYIGHNTTHDLTPRPLSNNQNAGEQIMWETTAYRSVNNPVSANTNTVTFSNLIGAAPATQIGLSLSVISGKGLGQTRTIVSLDSTNGTATIDRPWNVVPGSSSRIVRLGFFERIVVYDNDLDFKTRAAYEWPNSIASSGIQPYTGGADFIADGNRINQAHYAVSLWASEISGTPAPLFFPYIVNNVASESLTGVRNITFPSEGHRLFGAIFRKNSFDSAGIANSIGALLLGGTASLPSFSHCVWEHNQFTNSMIGIDHGVNRGPSEHEIFYKNILNRGIAPYIGSKAISFHALLSPALLNNSIVGFETHYTGTWPTPDNPMELPYRRFDLGESYGSSTSVPILDAGISPLSWTAMADASWLTLSPSSGMVLDQNGESSVVATIDASGLPVGTHSSDITFTSGAQTKIVTVNFTVSDLIAAYEFEDPGDSQADDSSGFLRHGALTGGATWSTDVPNGSSSSIYTPANAWVQTPPWSSPTNAITVSAWAKANATTFQGNASIACKRDAFILYPLGSSKNIRFYIHIGSWTFVDFDCSTISGFQANQWHHYAGTYDSATRAICIYVDGILRNTVFLPSYSVWPITSDIGPMTIGRDEGTENYFRGWLDGVRVFKRALFPSEISSLATY